MTSPVDKRVEVGAAMRLMCNVIQGDPPVTFQWTKEGRPVETIKGVKVDSLEFASAMLISRAQEAHTGNYTCLVSNPVGSSLVMTEILVNGN